MEGRGGGGGGGVRIESSLSLSRVTFVKESRFTFTFRNIHAKRYKEKVFNSFLYLILIACTTISCYTQQMPISF